MSKVGNFQKKNFDSLVEYNKNGILSKLIIDSFDLAVITTTIDGIITTWNKGAETIYGYYGSELIGENINILIPSDEINKIEKTIGQLVDGFEIPRFQVKRLNKNNVLLDVSVYLTAIKDEDGIIIGIVSTDRDISELMGSYHKIASQDVDKENRANELSIANKKLDFQNKEKEKRADELVIANKELIFQNQEKEKRAKELIIANKELVFQNQEKEKRANELIIANKELLFQNEEKEKRAAELIIANKELLFQNEEKGKRAAELVIADKELDFQNKEKDKRKIEKRELEKFSNSQEQASKYARSLIEASTDPLVTISAEGKITDVNEASIKATGVIREKLIGTDFSDYFTEPEKARGVYKMVFEKSFVADYPLTIKHKNGTLIDVLYNASVYKDSNGNVLGVSASARDVTAKKRAEVSLEKSLKEISGYKKALDESSIVAITDENGIINYANDNFCKISKYKREELIGKDHRIVNSGYHSSDFMADFWAVIQCGEIWRGEIKNRAKDGSIYWVDTTVVPFFNEDGEIYQYVSIRSDITAKKLLSQYSLSLIEASRDPLIVISPEGKITDMNEAMVHVTGISRADLKGSDFKEYFTDPKKASEVYQEVFKKGFVADYPLTIKDHKLTDVLFNGSVYKDDRGIVIGAVIVARDISEQKRYEKELTEAKVFAELATSIAEDAKIKAENAVKSKQQFLSNMSHEIRTPMNAIIGFTKVVLKTDLSIKQREYLQAIKVSGDALIVLINDILDLAKVDAGKMTFEKTPFKLASSISAMLHLFEPKIEEKNLVLVKEYDSRIPDVLVGDPIRLHQIILNLVSNAVKFTNNGKITVTVKLLSEDDENVNIEFAVIDTGIGISEHKIKNIFENFQQATHDTSRLYGGTGLGLAIVKQLVEPQGGKICVTSKIDEGSTFSFNLPFKKTNAEAEVEIGTLEETEDNRNIKVLVVEDIALNQLLMRTLLDDFGYGCDIAGNGKIAIEKLLHNTYDIILMDLQMPEMNGFEATEYIRNTLKLSIPIIALTADVTTVDVEKCKAVGMNDYLAKPVNEKLLYNKIKNLITKTSIEHKKMENPKILNKETRYTNLDYLINRTKSKPELMMEMISLYLEQTPPMIASMTKSFHDKDWSMLQATMHKILPSFTIVGIKPEFESIAKKIHEYASVQKQEDGIHDLVLKLESVCLGACKELQEEYNLIKNKK